MNRQHTVILQNALVRGEELDLGDFHDQESYRRCATQWGGPDGVMVLRNATLEFQGEQERVDFLLVRRSEVLAVGIGQPTIEGVLGSGPGLTAR